MELLHEIQLDREGPAPLYFQIAQILESFIKLGRLKPGEPMPSELEISEFLKVSRPTVRQAFAQLAQKGLVIRRRGIGTIVTQPRIHRAASLASFYDALEAQGRTPHTEVLKLEVKVSSMEAASHLSVPIGTEVVSIERIRSADGEPIALMHNEVPLDLFRQLPTKGDLETQSLYALIRAQWVDIHSTSQEIGARVATSREARLLHAPRSSTVLTMTRVAFDTTGRAVDFGQHSYLAHRYSFQLTMLTS